MFSKRNKKKIYKKVAYLEPYIYINIYHFYQSSWGRSMNFLCKMSVPGSASVSFSCPSVFVKVKILRIVIGISYIFYKTK